MNVFLDLIERGEKLSEDQMGEAMSLIMEGQATETQMSTFLIDLATRGESVEEITGAARVMREKARNIQAPRGAVDCCGTGGDQSGTYNVSTAVAFVTAVCSVPMAKHGNRASSSKSGAADVLEALGVNLDIAPERLEEALKLYNCAFLMAANHHQSMKHVAKVRKDIGQRTIFNLLGPLANPAGTRYQLMGVYDRKWLRPIAEVLKKLGTKRAWIVHGTDGLDEITVTGPTDIAILGDDGEITETQLSPNDFGLETHDMNDLLGGDAEENAVALRAVLEGKRCAYRDIVLANAAAVLMIHGKVDNVRDGAQKAAQAIDNGGALGLLRDYVAFSREA